MTILSTPGARSSPAVIFAFFSSKRFSKALRWPFSRSDTVSSCAFASSSLQADLEPLLARQVGEIRLIDRRVPGLQPLRARLGGLAVDHAAHALEQVVLEDALLVGQILANPLELGLLDRERARVLLDAVAGEHAHVDHRAVHARRHAQRGVLHVGGLLAEDRPQQLLFRRELGLALRRHLAHQDVARAHFGADEGDARLIELGERGVAHVRDVGRDLLGTRAWCRARRR